MLITSKLEIDLQQPGFKKVAYAVQNDSNTRALEISLFLGGTEWEIPSGTTAAVSFRKMDLTSGLYDTLPDGSTKAVTFSGNTLTAVLAPQVLTCAGKVDVSIALYDSSLNRLGVFPVLLYVSADPSAGKSISNNYYYLSTLAAVNEAIGDLNGLKTTTKESLVAAINELAQGTVSEDTIQDAVDAYLEKNGTGSILVDSTLTKEGYAADAKATGEAISKVSSQNVDYTNVANKPKINGVELSGDTSLDALGITAPTDEQVSNAVNDYLKENPVTATSEGDNAYKWAARGYMREHVRDFQGWAHCVRYDPDLGKAVGLVISGTGSHSNTAPYYRVEIDPATGYMSEYVEVVVNYPEDDTLGETGYIGSFVIKPDGTYWMCDYNKRIFTSVDKGYTWDYLSSITLGRTTYNNDFLFGAIRLSNGYMVAGNGGNPAAETYYSTDDGVTWNVVTMNRSGLGQQVYPEGGYTPFEPFFVECGGGKVIQYARASMNAYKTYAEGGCTAKEAACYSVSDDYGITWSAWQWSTALTDMTANNGKAVVIGDKVHAVYGSRYHAEDNYFHLFYATTTLTDILDDKWETPVVIDAGHWDVETATNPHDCGYPSIFADANNNLFAVYYDSDGTGTAYGANWRLCIGTQAAAQVAPVTSEGKGSTVVGYTQSAVDKLIQSLLNKINDLYLKIGELPEQDGLDGSLPVLDGLVAWFEPGDSTQYGDDGYTIKSKVGDYTAYSVGSGSQSYIRPTAPDKFTGNMVKGGIAFQDDLSLADYGITDELAMEFVLDMYDNQNHYLLIEHKDSSFNAMNTSILAHTNNFGSAYVKVAVHVVYTITTEATKIYVNGSYAADGTTLTAEQLASAHPLCRVSNGAIGGVRLYNRALTEDEIKNNYKYASTLTTFGTDYFT